MFNVEERNAYIKEHLVELKRIRDGYAGILHRRFESVPLCDLQGYGWLGVIHGLDRVEPESPTFDSFVRRYVYLYILTGSLEMMGIQRDRSRKSVETPTFESYDPHDLVHVIDSVQDMDLRACGGYDAVLDRLEIEHLLNVVEGRLEAQVLMGLIQHQGVSEIARCLDVSVKKVRKCIETLIVLAKREQAINLPDAREQRGMPVLADSGA